MATIIRLWKTASGGRQTSTISGRVSCMSGRKMRSTALPIQASSIGGLPPTVAAVGDAGDVEDGVFLFHGVEAGVVTEGAFAAEFAEIHIAFEDVLGVGGNFEVDRLAAHEFDRLVHQETGEEI